MIYHFFAKWKEIELEIQVIKGQIKEVEDAYKKKISLFSIIWDELREEKIDYKTARKLLALYGSKEANVYEHILK